MFPPQQPAHSAGEGGLTSLPRAAGEPCGAAGPSAFARWPAGSVGAGGGGGGAAAGYPGPLTCFTGTSPGQSRPMLLGTHSLGAGKIAAHSWAGSGPRQGVQFTRLRPGANSSAFVKC